MHKICPRHVTPKIVLTTINARYIHASLGLRYLHANLGELREQTEILEFIITQRPIDIVERLLARNPEIIGFGVYIWNVECTTQVAGIIKSVRPDILIVLGGPEISYETAQQPLAALADHIICGQGDRAFAELCHDLLCGAETQPAKVIPAPVPDLQTLVLPYDLYSDTDIKQRLIYVEASRGCPFKCEFCLSALDRTAWPFCPDNFLDAMAKLHARGARHFKFVDRTFNLNSKFSVRILDFFLERLDEKLFLHFELIPDYLPEILRERIACFPPGSLQFEIGVQTLNPEVQALISRKQDNSKARINITWLRQHTHAHIHVDLIAGLPGETMASFAAGFDEIWALQPQEIQVGILKRLRGSPIIRHTDAFAMCYNPGPPYNVLSTSCMKFEDLQRINRFARYWDLIANSGRFVHTLPLLLAKQPFDNFMRFTDWLFKTTGQTHQFAVERLFDLMHAALTSEFGQEPECVCAALAADFCTSGHKRIPDCLQGRIKPHRNSAGRGMPTPATERQARHLKTTPDAGPAEYFLHD